MIIGIIGGKGKMGRLFGNLFRKYGHKIIVSDINTKLTNENLVKTADAILFSVPINKTVQVIESIIPYTRKDQLLMDLTSIKTPAINAMLKSDSEVLGLHPMFGPTNEFKSQIIVACKERERNKSKIILGIFRKEGMKIKISAADKHDKIMASVQGLTHFNSIVLGHALSKGSRLKDTLEYSSPIYKMRLAMSARILAQDAKLYGDIAIENPYFVDSLEEIEKSTKELIEIIRKKDKKSFENYFKNASEYVNDFKKESIKLTDKMIEGIKDE